MNRSLAIALFMLVSWHIWSQETSPSPTELSPDAAQALLIKRVPPLYPPLARQARIQGTVVLQIVINKAGDVRDVRLVSGHPMLAPAAIEAVKQWKYQPYMIDGETIDVSTNVQVNFRMRGEPAVGTVGSVPGGLPPGASGSIRGTSSAQRVSEAEMRALRVEKVDPVYPALAVQARVQGMVTLEVQINASGDVENVMLLSGHPLLVRAAIEAVKQWKYRPYTKDGVAVAVETEVRLTFAVSPNDGPVVSEPPAVSLPEPAAGVPRRVRVSAGVSQVLLVKKVTPEYPEDARQQHVQGVVLLHVNIDQEGNVSNVELISGHPLLADAAIEAVRQWKYRSYLLNGEPVEVDTQVQVNFTLAD